MKIERKWWNRTEQPNPTQNTTNQTRFGGDRTEENRAHATPGEKERRETCRIDKTRRKQKKEWKRRGEERKGDEKKGNKAN